MKPTKTRARMRMLVSFRALGTNYTVEVVDVANEAEARDAATTQIARRFHETFIIDGITPIRTQARKSLWRTYADGFRLFLSRFDTPICE